MNVCDSCLRPLEGNLTPLWADGDNHYAYITCRNCSYDQTVYGFGEDD